MIGAEVEAPRPAARRSSGKPGTRKGVRKRGKFNNVRVEYKGMKFDSKVELARYKQLEEMQERGVIGHLRRQVRFPLYCIVLYDDEVPYDPEYPLSPTEERNAEKVCDYVADFEYFRYGDVTDDYVVEDVKGGPVTPLFRLKKKMMKTCYNIDVVEVRMGRVA